MSINSSNSSKQNKLIILKNNQGQALRILQSQSEQVHLVQNNSTKRVELLDSHYDYKETHSLLQKIELKKEGMVSLNSLGSLTIHHNLNSYNEHTLLDPQSVNEDNEIGLPKTIKWSSISHGTILSILLLFYLFIPQKKSSQDGIKPDALVNIQIEKATPSIQAQAPKPPPPSLPSPISNSKDLLSQAKSKKNKVITVAPRINKTHSLRVTRSGTSKGNKFNFAKNSPQSHGSRANSFQRLGTIGAISNALKGVRSGSGSGLRVSDKSGVGGMGRGAGIGKGNGTMGHGSDNGGGYAQALYGKGLIAAQVGGGGGGFGSGWGDGTPGAGSYGTKGKGGGHEGYGTSRLGSGARSFSFPVSDEAMVEGGLDREAVDLVVMKNLGQITYCYELGLQKKPTLRGRVIVDFIINGQGRVTSQSIVSSSLKSSSVESCMLSKIKNWKFPRPVGGVNVDVNYPFALQRVSGSGQQIADKGSLD